MYILTDYTLILSKETRPLVREGRPEHDCAGKGRSNSKLQTVLSSERALKITNPQLSKGNLKEEEKLVADSRWVPDTEIDLSTDCRS
jgi:hypothetical protein